MWHHKIKVFGIAFLMFSLFACGVPLPTDRTSVFPATGYHRFKPVVIEKYKGDTLTVSNYLIANCRTGSYLSGIQPMEIDEDSVLTKILNSMGKQNLNLNLSDKQYNILNPNIVFEDKHSWNKRIENNVFQFVSEINKMEGELNLIPAILFRVDHSAGGYGGFTELSAWFNITFIVFIFNQKKELVFKDGSGINGKDERFDTWKEAFAFPIEESVTEEHFEEMIREALRDYLE